MSQITPLLDRLGEQLGVANPGSVVPTALPGVAYFRATEPTPRTPLLYEAGILILGQGSKTIHLGDRSYTYDADNYLVLTVPLPLECQTFASEDDPVQGIYVEIDLTALYEIVAACAETGRTPSDDADVKPSAVSAVPLDADMSDAVARLLRSLVDPLEARVLGPSFRNEIVFRALLGRSGPALFALASHDDQHARIARILHRLHTEFERPLVVEDAAREAGMSVSAFHRAFKQVTADSPLQYLKKVRLNRARNLLAMERERVGTAADRVGYESASQFSREFKRYFGISPAEARAAAPA